MGYNRRLFEPLRDGPILTIGQAHNSRKSLWAFCRNCARSADVDTWKLIQRVQNRDMALEEAARRFRCRRCLNTATILIPGDGFAHAGGQDRM